MAARSRCRRRRGRQEWWGVFPSPSRLGGLGERRKLLQLGPGRSLGRKQVWVHSELESTHVVTTNLVFIAGGRPTWRGYIAYLIPPHFSRGVHPSRPPRIYAHGNLTTGCYTLGTESCMPIYNTRQITCLSVSLLQRWSLVVIMTVDNTPTSVWRVWQHILYFIRCVCVLCLWCVLKLLS